MLINLIPHMTYFITTLLLMAVSVLTKVNFLKLEDLCMWLTWSNCPSHADQFDTPYDLLHHYSNPHGNVRAHQGQLLEVEELVHVTHVACLCSSCWPYWYPTRPTSAPLCTSWQCPCSLRSTSWSWRTCARDQSSLFALLMLIVLMPHMTQLNSALHLTEFLNVYYSAT